MNTALGPSDQQITKMREAVLTSLPAPHLARRRRRVLIGSGVGIAALASVAAAALIAPATVDQRNVSVDCYGGTDLNSAHATTTLVDDGRNHNSLDPLAARIQRALDLCAAERTAVSTGAKPIAVPSDIPDQTVCQLGDLRLVVLPNKSGLTAIDFCTQLGLQVPTS